MTRTAAARLRSSGGLRVAHKTVAAPRNRPTDSPRVLSTVVERTARAEFAFKGWPTLDELWAAAADMKAADVPSGCVLRIINCGPGDAARTRFGVDTETLLIVLRASWSLD